MKLTSVLNEVHKQLQEKLLILDTKLMTPAFLTCYFAFFLNILLGNN